MIAPIRNVALFAGTSPVGLSVVKTKGARMSATAIRPVGTPEWSDLTTWQKRWLCCAEHTRSFGDSTCTREPNPSASSKASTGETTVNTPTCIAAIHAAPTRVRRRRIEYWMNTPAALMVVVA